MATQRERELYEQGLIMQARYGAKPSAAPAPVPAPAKPKQVKPKAKPPEIKPPVAEDTAVTLHVPEAADLQHPNVTWCESLALDSKGKRVITVDSAAGNQAPSELLIPYLLGVLAKEDDLFATGSQLRLFDGRVLRDLNHATIGEVLNRQCSFMSEGARTDKWYSFPPGKVCSAVMGRRDYPELRQVDMLLGHPTVNVAGEVLGLQTGYCERSRALYVHDLKYTPHSTEQAARALYEPLREFTPKCLAGAMSMVFSLLCRIHVGNTPLHMFDAHTEGSGKTLLLQVCCLMAGLPVPTPTTVSADTVEFDKACRTAVIEGGELIFFDNATGFIKSAALDAALTGDDRAATRLFGTLGNWAGPYLSTVALTSNNAELSADLARRAIRIDVDPGVEDPGSRRTERTPAELRQYVQAHRDQLLSAALSWLQHARHLPAVKLNPLASFDTWRTVVASAAFHLLEEWKRLGLVPAKTESDPTPSTVKRHNSESQALTVLISETPPNGFTIAEVLNDSQSVIRRALVELIGEPPQNDPKIAGLRLRKYTGKYRDGRAMVSRGPENKAKRWYALSQEQIDSGYEPDRLPEPEDPPPF